ncbi:MAG: hypothetical protein ACI9OJ_005372 [Myxococcota bacterium]|jgi:hypothetical protein
MRTRRATPDDAARLSEMFAEVTMESDLHLAVERPDFYAFYEMQQADYVAFVCEVDGRIEGLGSVLGRDGFVGGERQRIGYAGDLRLTKKVRGTEFLTEHYGGLLDQAGEAVGTRLFYTGIITSNRRAVAALTQRQERWPDIPVYTEFQRFQITNVQFTGRKKPRATGLDVRPATDSDIAAIAGFLGNQHRDLAFGYPFDEAFLRERLRRWPGLGIAEFILAFDGPTLVGVVASWDAWDVKRYRVLGYYNKMRWIRLGFNALAPFVRAASLPKPGGLLRYFYLTHVGIEGLDPAIMSALLDHVYAAKCAAGYHFFSAAVLQDDPLAPAFKRFTTTPLPAALYTVTRPGDPIPIEALRDARPGFEMALV